MVHSAMPCSRRTFVRRALAAASVGGLGGPALAQSPRGGGLAIGTYGLQSMPLEEAVRLVAETGYNAIEIAAMPGMTGSPSRFSTGDRKRLRSVLADSGLRLCAIMADLQPKRLEADHQKQLAELYHLIQFGHALSPDRAPVVQTVLGGKDWGASREFFRDRIANWVQVAGDLRGFLSIKPHRYHAMSRPSEALWLIEQLGSPERLGMTFDYSHYAFLDPELPIEATVREALPRTNYVAVKDAVLEDGKVRFALPGEGDAWDHADIVSAFYDGGYRGDFCCEVSSQIWRAPGYDPVAATKLCFESMKAAFDRAGVARR